jgi:exopolysaccharide biosynthesis WecB/TagA/CpsF family protein
MAFDGSSPYGKEVDFLGLSFAQLDMDSALDVIAARGAIGARFGYVTTPNVDHMVGLAAEPARLPLYEHAWLRLNDSRVLEALALRAGYELPAIPGADIARRLFAEIIDPDEPITIIGGDEEMIEALKRRYTLTDVRWHQPPQGLKHKPGAIVAAAAFAASQSSRFTFLCVGAPQQEMLAYAIAQRGDARGVGLCLGASLEFLAGRVERAPSWMQRARLEWLHRLAKEPKRMWRRYLVDGPRVFALFSAWRASIASASAA